MTPLIPDSGQCCPVCSSAGVFVAWRGLNQLFRCPCCGQTFIADDLGSLEEDLSAGGPA